MTNHEEYQPPVVSEAQSQILTVPTERERSLRDLMGTDYEYAVNSGLLDIFEYDAESHEDAVMHILTGEIEHINDTLVPGGFHLESASQSPQTYVEREHLSQKKAREARKFKEVPFNPYMARVVIGGLHKVNVKYDSETGKRMTIPLNNGMFPKEYDSLAVLQTIKLAYENIDTEKVKDSGDILSVDSEVPMLDGETMMTIRMLLNRESGKIISAFPKVGESRMKLNREEIKNYLGLN